MTALTKNVADELGKYGINVTVVHPGATNTERAAELRDRVLINPATRDLHLNNVIGRVVEPQEVAWVVAFLASPRSVAITGDGILAGGGIPGFIYYDTTPQLLPKEITVTDSPSATLSAKELHELRGGAAEFALIDVREPRVTAEQGSILLAVSVPLSGLELHVGLLIPRLSTPVIVYDSGDGDLADRGAARLRELGYTDVRTLAGGIPRLVRGRLQGAHRR